MSELTILRPMRRGGLWLSGDSSFFPSLLAASSVESMSPNWLLTIVDLNVELSPGPMHVPARAE